MVKLAQWKLNCFLQKQLCDSQLPNQDLYVGQPEDKGEQAYLLKDIGANESVYMW